MSKLNTIIHIYLISNCIEVNRPKVTSFDQIYSTNDNDHNINKGNVNDESKCNFNNLFFNMFFNLIY
jgi:hypothetical protein